MCEVITVSSKDLITKGIIVIRMKMINSNIDKDNNDINEDK